MTFALLDGDIIAYRAACVGERDDDFGEPGAKVYSLKDACEAADKIIQDWTHRSRGKTPVVCFSSRERNFRYQVYPSYKHNRRGEKPRLYWPVVDRIEKTYRTLRKPLLEADDVIGILSTSDPSKYIGVSVDKDLRTLPARIFNPDKDAIPVKILPGIADRFWMFQTLIGDSVDGYPGCPKVGPVNAERLLDGHLSLERMWPVVVDAFREKGLTEDDAVTQARLARILRFGDFDTTTREIILWHPTVPTRLPTVASGSTTREPGNAPSVTSGDPQTSSSAAHTTSARSSRRASPTPSKAASPAPRRAKRRSRTNLSDAA